MSNKYISIVNRTSIGNRTVVDINDVVNRRNVHRSKYFWRQIE